VYARYLDDKNQFITPIPVIQHGSDTFSAYPGFVPLTATYNSQAIQHVRLDGIPTVAPTPTWPKAAAREMWFVGPTSTRSLQRMVDQQLCWPTAAMSIPTRILGSNPNTFNDAVQHSTDLGGFGLPAGSATATFVGGGAVGLDQSVIHQGWWFIHKELQNINNDFRLSKELREGNTLTLGLYLAYYEMDDKWALGNQMFMTNEPNARPITVSYVDAGQTFLKTDDQGFLDNGGYNIAQHGHAFNSAIYLSDSWRINKWLLDASVRYEREEATNNVCNLSNVDTDANPLTLYNNAVPVCNGSTAVTDYDENFTSWTAGANYSFTDSMSAYVRVNRGGHFLDFDNGIRGSTAPPSAMQ
jgi:outer membrane receptor protein involved in Fe transport